MYKPFSKNELELFTSQELDVMQQRLHHAAGDAMKDGTAEEIEGILQLADSVEVELSCRSGIPLR